MSFTPRIKGIDPNAICEISGKRGGCYIASAGGMPEREHTFYYADPSYEFCFYVTRSWDGNVFDIDIYNATRERFTSLPPSIRVGDLGYILHNIQIFVSTRDS